MSILMKGALLLVPFFLCCNLAVGQGARSAALGHSNVCLQDEAAVFNNVAGVAKLHHFSAISSYHNRFGMASLSTIEAGLVAPIKFGVITADINRYGNSLYNESRVGVGFAHSISNISLGLKASYQQIFIEEYGTRGVMVLEFGGVAEIIPKFYFGAHIFNLNQAAYAKENRHFAPVIMKTGLGYQPIQKLLLLVEVEKNVKYKTQFRGGIEYNIIPRLFLRTGISTNPVRNSFGLGIVMKKIKVDYSLSSYQRLGFQHSFSLILNIKKQKGS